jgi:DNA-binding MurR/RpiR family transcriptional regulator
MTLPPYTREATHVAELGRSREARILLFTDSPRCPAYSLADEIIHCESDSVLMANSYVGIVAVMQILLNLLCIRDKDDAASRLKALFALERAGYAHLSDIAAES